DRQNNTQVAFYQNYVLALDRIQAWDEAMEVLARINFDVLDPRNLSRFLFLRGNILANQEKLNEAEPDLRRAIEIDANNFDARLSYGKLLFVSGNLLQAREAFTDLLELDPQHYSADEARILIETIDGYLAQQPGLQAPLQ
ncbi:MAG: tetratricopeptide repeat protein, partial [Gammaproteobacteria bacterium]